MRLFLLPLLLCLGAKAQELAPFVAPAAYPLARYEADGLKNPFTLKTAPLLTEQASFARDLVIGAYYGDTSDPTVVIVNMKTRERLRLKKNQPAANGITLTGVTFGISRKDTVAELTLGGEKTSVRCSDDFLKQAAPPAKAPASRSPVPPQSVQMRITSQGGERKPAMPDSAAGPALQPITPSVPPASATRRTFSAPSTVPVVPSPSSP